jgi:hypothetical protein
LNEGILPNILTIFSTWEGHIAWPQLEASTFVKLSAFVVCCQISEMTSSNTLIPHLTDVSCLISDYSNLLCFHHFRKY